MKRYATLDPRYSKIGFWVAVSGAQNHLCGEAHAATPNLQAANPAIARIARIPTAKSAVRREGSWPGSGRCGSATGAPAA